jgi:ketosteroid isomerase-like protein
MTPAEAIEGVFDAWRHLDVERLIPLFTEDARYEDPLWPQPVIGHDDMRTQIAGGMAELADCAITIRGLLEAGDLAMVEAEFRSALASGQGRLDFDFMMLVELRDGRVARLAEYFDTRPLVPA